MKISDVKIFEITMNLNNMSFVVKSNKSLAYIHHTFTSDVTVIKFNDDNKSFVDFVNAKDKELISEAKEILEDYDFFQE